MFADDGSVGSGGDGRVVVAVCVGIEERLSKALPAIYGNRNAPWIDGQKRKIVPSPDSTNTLQHPGLFFLHFFFFTFD